MRILLALILLAIATRSWGQDKCSAIVDWRYLEPIGIYATPGGEVIAQLRNDSVAEDFIEMEILDESRDHLHVSITMSIARDVKTGWIKKAEYIGAYLRHEQTPRMNLSLFETPSAKKPIVVKDWMPALLTIEECKGKWVRVSTTQNGQRIVGWIAKSELCANAYTTCN